MISYGKWIIPTFSLNYLGDGRTITKFSRLRVAIMEAISAMDGEPGFAITLPENGTNWERQCKFIKSGFLRDARDVLYVRHFLVGYLIVRPMDKLGIELVPVQEYLSDPRFHKRLYSGPAL